MEGKSVGEGKTLIIAVLTDSRLEGCQADCTTCWASREPLPELLRRIEERFGEGVTVRYVDLANPVLAAQYREIAERIRDRNLPYPVLAIDGQPHLVGCFDYRMVAEMIEAQLELLDD